MQKAWVGNIGYFWFQYNFFSSSPADIFPIAFQKE